MILGFDRDSLLNEDEITINVRSRNYSNVSANWYKKSGSGQERTSVSIRFTATSSGTKLKSLKSLIQIPKKSELLANTSLLN